MKLMTTREVAALLGVSPRTVLRIPEKELRPVTLIPSRLYQEAKVIKFAETYQPRPAHRPRKTA